MEKFYESCNLTHNEEICEKGHPNCWLWESHDEELDYYISEYTSPEKIKEIYDIKIIEMEDIDRIYYLNYEFDENNIIYQENEIIKSILSRHTIKRHLLLDYKSYEKEVTKTLVDFSHDIVDNKVVLTFINNITKESTTELESYFANNKSEQMQAVIDIIDGFTDRDGIYPEHVTKGVREEYEGYLDKNPIPSGTEYVVSDFECEETEDGQYQLQLKVNDEWHYYLTEGDNDSLLSKDELIHIVDLLLERIKSEDTSVNDIVSSLIGYFINIDLPDYDITPVGNMYEIENKLTEQKAELLNFMNDN